MTNPPPFRKPTSSPAPTAARDIADWETLVETSVERVTAAAEKWRTGLAGFLTIVASVLVLKGPDAQKIQPLWRLLVVALFVTGAVLAVVGLWKALSASSPTIATQNLVAIIEKYGSIRAQGISAATHSSKLLDRAKVWVLFSLIAFGAGIVAWWLVPQSTEPPRPVDVSITSPDGSTIACGPITESKGGFVTIKPGDATPTTIPLAGIETIVSVPNCEGDAR